MISWLAGFQASMAHFLPVKQAADMTQNNVRRQAASSVLAQANQNPQLALQLLGGA
ncbi:MAG: flagellin [Bacteroidales bacterium]